MTTLTVLIGNSDNKLTQQEWANFYEKVSTCICDAGNEVHFRGHSSTVEPFQNACWVVSIDPGVVYDLMMKLTEIRKSYRQDSVAVVTGETRFI